ncbi:MAG: hypothetical protein ACR2N5_03885 [Solirubrobacterales bacterium]
MARALIVGCGCRGRSLGRSLLAEGWEVRGTSRSVGGLNEIAAAGLEAAEADPERPGTVLDLVADVTVLVWLLGSAAGPRNEVEAIHGPRLASLLEKLVDTPVRGFAYEASGSVTSEVLAGGRALVSDAATRWHIPVAFIEGQVRSADDWAAASRERVLGLVHGASGHEPAPSDIVPPR